MNQIFEIISREENGSFLHQKEKFQNIIEGSFMERDVYILDLEHNRHKIHIRNTMGPTAVGNFKVVLPNFSRKIKFSISGKNHFVALFTGKKDMLNIKCNDSAIEGLIRSSHEFNQIHDLAKQYAFEPEIMADMEQGVFQITADYHLAFKEREEALRPLIRFFKFLIDKFGNG
ncbi:MAG: hypothetical protein MK105_02355 [Crocinitomicaceae bacterium]|nr:hypothetical protein [Crocinitomicaceae bacterium]